MNGCVKGKVGEREWRDFLRERGINAIRGQQHSGGNESPDVKSDLDHFVHWEVKRVENLSIYPALDQCKLDSAKNQMPVVAHRRNHKEWICTVRADDLIRLLLIAQAAGGGDTVRGLVMTPVPVEAPEGAVISAPDPESARLDEIQVALDAIAADRLAAVPQTQNP